MKKNYKSTVNACFAGYVVQAIVNNFVPLLFLTFNKSYGIELSKITALITVNFILQLCIDFLSAFFIDKIGYRAAAVAAHVFAAAGLVSLTVLPDILPSPFVGLLISVVPYAVGGGLLEVIVSPIVEACPTDKKSAAMSLLHSFYCWGHVAVILLTTLFFVTAGIENWRVLAYLWAIVPFANAVYFCLVPINSLAAEEGSAPMKELFKSKLFWILAVLMICSGASEQAMSQWSSAFAETGLKVSKTVGDLLGPCMFATLMGLSRVLYAAFSEKIKLTAFIRASCVMCVAGYLIASFAPHPMLALAGCGICGFSVGILWPGVFSLAAKYARNGATAMFALLALAGDLGCASGPALVGAVSGAFGDDLKVGFLAAIIFPALLVAGIFILERHKPENNNERR